VGPGSLHRKTPQKTDTGKGLYAVQIELRLGVEGWRTKRSQSCSTRWRHRRFQYHDCTFRQWRHLYRCLEQPHPRRIEPYVKKSGGTFIRWEIWIAPI